MPCTACSAHRQKVKTAIRQGQVRQAGVEVMSGLRTMNEKMVARLLQKKRTK